MGFSIHYDATEQISPALQREMTEAANQLLEGRTWLSCEPPLLSEYEGSFGGGVKPNVVKHPEDVAAAQQEALPDGTLNNAIEVLCELSRRFDVDWEISHDHSDGPLGYIRCGVCDEDVREFCDAMTDVAGDLFPDGFDSEGFDLDDL
jgi:hypothetical protein